MGKTSAVEVITFDCYGTLIDWESGIQTAFKQLLPNLEQDKSRETRLFELYEKEEKRIESSETYRPYRTVLAEALAAAAKSLGKTIPDEAAGVLAKQLPAWRPFSDTNPALKRLKKEFDLGILSNVDNDLLNGTLENLAVSFDFVVTAEEVRSYKPRPNHFNHAKDIIGKRGWLHAAASLYHDIEPATRMGINSVWVNRKNVAYSQNLPKWEIKVQNLAELADRLIL